MSLPPISALEALDALGRTGSVREAAQAVNLSQSAVSHKLNALEARLGFALTRPEGRGVALTAQGRRYLDAVRPGLEALRMAHRGVGEARGPLDVACISGLSATWLARRIGGFLETHPEVSLTLRAIAADAPRPGSDLTISFLGRPPAGAVHLLDVRFFPVVQPARFESAGRPGPEALRADQLLHLENREDWAGWLRLAGSDGRAAQGGVAFQGLLTMYAAAESGLGFCLGDSLTCADALRSGRLIRPYDAELAVPYGYWALPPAGGLTAPAEAFLDWIRREVVRAEA